MTVPFGNVMSHGNENFIIAWLAVSIDSSFSLYSVSSFNVTGFERGARSSTVSPSKKRLR